MTNPMNFRLAMKPDTAEIAAGTEVRFVLQGVTPEGKRQVRKIRDLEPLERFASPVRWSVITPQALHNRLFAAQPEARGRAQLSYRPGYVGSYAVTCFEQDGDARRHLGLPLVFQVGTATGIAWKSVGEQARRGGPVHPFYEWAGLCRRLDLMEADERRKPVPPAKTLTYFSRKSQLEDYRDALAKLFGFRRQGAVHSAGRYALEPFYAAWSGEGGQTDLRVCLRWAAGAAAQSEGPFAVDLVDFSNPVEKSFVFHGQSETSREAAIRAAIERWQEGSPYPRGQIMYRIPESYGPRVIDGIVFDSSPLAKPPRHEAAPRGGFDTPAPGKVSFWAEAAKFLDWASLALGLLSLGGTFYLRTGMKALLKGAVKKAANDRIKAFTRRVLFTATASSLASAGSATIRIATAADSDGPGGKLVDVLTIVGSLLGLKKLWLQGANFAHTTKGGKALFTTTLYANFGTDGIQGIFVVAEHAEKIRGVLDDPSLAPDERVDELWKLIPLAAAELGFSVFNLASGAQEIAFRRRYPDAHVKGKHVDVPDEAEVRAAAEDGEANAVTEHPRKRPAARVAPALRDPIDANVDPRGVGRQIRRGLADWVEAKSKELGKRIVLGVRDLSEASLRWIGKTEVRVIDGVKRTVRYEPKPEALKAKSGKADGCDYNGVVCFHPGHKRTYELLAKGDEAAMKRLGWPDDAAKPLARRNAEFQQLYAEFRKHELESKGYHVRDDEGYVVERLEDGVIIRYHGDLDLYGIWADGKLLDGDSEALWNEINEYLGLRVVVHGAHVHWGFLNVRQVAGVNAGPAPGVRAGEEGVTFMSAKGGEVDEKWLSTKSAIRGFLVKEDVAWGRLFGPYEMLVNPVRLRPITPRKGKNAEPHPVFDSDPAEWIIVLDGLE